MIDEYAHAINSGNEPLYPYAFIEQHGTSTKRFIDDILTVSLGSQTGGPTFEQIIKQQGNIYGGLYPSFIEDADGEEIENPISVIKEQSGETVHFLTWRYSKVNLVCLKFECTTNETTWRR